MIEQFFTYLNRLTGQGNSMALIGALLWGIAGVVLSPCHLASVPLVVAYVNRGTVISTRRALGLSILFSLGIFISIAGIGLVTAVFGRLLGDIGPWGNYVVAGVFMVFGLVLLDVIPLPWSGANLSNSSKTGAWGAAVLGLIFGTAVGPCTFAYMAPVLAVVFESAGTTFLYSASLVLLYGIGHCSVIVLAGILGARLQTFLNWDQNTHMTGRIRKTCGFMLILVGLYLLWKV